MFIDDVFNEQEDGDGSPELSPKRKEILKEVIHDPLYGEKEILLNKVGKKSLPSPSKSTLKASTRKDKLKKSVRKKEEEEVDGDYIFKFMNHYIYKPMDKGFEDVI
ncbi:hypothetical protein E5676_scaffold419G00410 [Cucumis melo var. makuwa]|uniref:Uncharacterized protein n=1 Tax=Cucumis melo var. makuwa TaxID=1194695 RepID=A0A5D3DJV1_CUCMM|nr:hypothetical protein E6C27_scaffold55G00680 [Cucumis melo var. makuwa]TYK23867.1 hypothetical protein E5676_scaffold419G00410 [Cucumis melo var. makuwa]